MLPVTVVVNEAAHGGERRPFRRLETAIATRRDPPVRIVFTAPGVDVRELARRAIADGCGTIVAAGGDGTVSGVASVVAGTNVALGVVPLGTLNHFARALGLPLDVERAAEVALGGAEKRVDVAEVNGRVFVNNSSVGIYPRFVLARRKAKRAGRDRRLATLHAALAAIQGVPSIPVVIRGGGVTLSRAVPFVFVGNNRYTLAPPHRVGRREALDTGRLDVLVPRESGRAAITELALRLATGRLRLGVDVDAIDACEIEIASPRASFDVASDGEITKMTSPLTYRIRPGALRVRIPERAP